MLWYCRFFLLKGLGFFLLGEDVNAAFASYTKSTSNVVYSINITVTINRQPSLLVPIALQQGSLPFMHAPSLQPLGHSNVSDLIPFPSQQNSFTAFPEYVGLGGISISCICCLFFGWPESSMRIYRRRQALLKRLISSWCRCSNMRRFGIHSSCRLLLYR